MRVGAPACPLDSSLASGANRGISCRQHSERRENGREPLLADYLFNLPSVARLNSEHWSRSTPPPKGEMCT